MKTTIYKKNKKSEPVIYSYNEVISRVGVYNPINLSHIFIISIRKGKVTGENLMLYISETSDSLIMEFNSSLPLEEEIRFIRFIEYDGEINIGFCNT